MEVTEEMRSWSESFPLATYDVGPGRTLHLSRLLFLVQETSERHLAHFGIGYERLWDAGIAFLTAKTWVKIERFPILHETVTIETHPCGVKGAQFIRSFDLYVGKELCAQVVQTSVAVDPVSHKILHPRVFEQIEFDPSCGGEAIMFPQRIKTGKQPVLGIREIRYSDLDYNGHLSNAVYVDFLTDYLPGCPEIHEFQINYVNECRLGDPVVLHGGQDETGRWLVYGEHARGRAFEAYVK